MSDALDELRQENKELADRIQRLEMVLSDVCQRLSMNKELDTWNAIQKWKKFDPKQKTLYPHEQKRIV